jgi:hypothetical protein
MILDNDILKYRGTGTAVVMTFLFAALVVCGCDKGQDVVSGASKLDTYPPPSPIEQRTNPLQTYIRANWTNGDPARTGGYHRGHIKVHGHCYTNLANFGDGDDQARFIADNFDMYMWGGEIVGDYMKVGKSLWLYESTNIPHIGNRHDSLTIAAWLADPAKNTVGYTFDDLVMHYKWDVDTWLGFTPGWNPADDRDHDLCRDLGPSDPLRTAQCIWDAEVRKPNFWEPGQFRRRVKIMHPGYIAAIADKTVNWWGERGGNGFYYDCAVYENWSIQLDKTFTYEGEDEADPNFRMRVELLLFVPTVVKAIERRIGVQDIYLANTITPYYSCAIPESKQLALTYLENSYNENWIVTNDPESPPMSKDRRENYLNCPFIDWMERDKGYVFTCYDPHGTDRGKRFSLALFYMINHQMAFYAYRTDDHWLFDGQNVRDKQWNEYVDFDVGQPATNALGLSDFQGNVGTNRYFVWISHDDYEILGREYLREDGQRVIVLVKIMERNQTEGVGPTVHPLPNTCRLVQADLSLGDPINEIVLYNNDGVILIETGN